MSDSPTAPSAPTVISMTIASRSWPSAERRQVSGELLRKHREDLGGRVNGRGVGPRVAIDRRAFLDDRVDVGHRDENLHRAARGWHRDRELVEIARIIVVDRCPEQAPKVAERRASLRSQLRRWRLLSARTAATEKSGSRPLCSIACRAMLLSRSLHGAVFGFIGESYLPGSPLNQSAGYFLGARNDRGMAS